MPPFSCSHQEHFNCIAFQSMTQNIKDTIFVFEIFECVTRPYRKTSERIEHQVCGEKSSVICQENLRLFSLIKYCSGFQHSFFNFDKTTAKNKIKHRRFVNENEFVNFFIHS